MQIAVCDDSPHELECVVSLLADYRERKCVPLTWHCFQSATELSATIRPAEYELLILDILMPQVNGMTIAHEIRKIDTDVNIVFLTSSPEFAVESYRIHALDYILKPINGPKLFPLLDKLFAEKLSISEGLTVKSINGAAKIPYSKLMYVEVLNKQVHFHLADGSIRTTRSTLSKYETILLGQHNFLKPHRSYIINLMYTVEIKNSCFILCNGENIPISRLLLPQIRSEYMEYLFGKMGDTYE